MIDDDMIVFLPDGRLISCREQRAVDEMAYPVRCGACGKIYDLGKVTVISRFVDCSVWKAPCCGVPTDDREWSHPRYTVMEKSR